MTEVNAPGQRQAFAARAVAAMRRHGPLCVGVDPHPELLAAWGMSDDAAGLRRFSGTVLEAVAGRVAAVKPQSAFFERHGAAGLAVLEQLLADLAAAGTLSVLDVKRGDIGSTMGAYADAYLADGAPLAADAITASPYLGYGSLRPALDLAAAQGRGVFVLALTSNPEGAQVQQRGRPTVAAAMAAGAARDNAGAVPAGHVGLVVGASGQPVVDLGIDLSAVNGLLLTPGVGAQGGSPADLARRFAGATGRVLAPVSRSVLRHGPEVRGLREAIGRLAGELADTLAP